MLFPRKAHSTEKTPFTRMSPPGTHFTAVSTEAIRIKCLAQGHNILILPGFQPTISVSTHRHLNHVTNMLLKYNLKKNRKHFKDIQSSNRFTTILLLANIQQMLQCARKCLKYWLKKMFCQSKERSVNKYEADLNRFVLCWKVAYGGN